MEQGSLSWSQPEFMACFRCSLPVYWEGPRASLGPGDPPHLPLSLIPHASFQEQLTEATGCHRVKKNSYELAEI